MMVIPEAASNLLTLHEGIQRNAEAAAWAEQGRFGPGSEGYKFWADVALCIVAGNEEPKVLRQAFIPTPAFKPMTIPV